jgi:hypothetical protein
MSMHLFDKFFDFCFCHGLPLRLEDLAHLIGIDGIAPYMRGGTEREGREGGRAGGRAGERESVTFRFTYGFRANGRHGPETSYHLCRIH